MSEASQAEARSWRDVLPAGVRPYTEKAPIAAFFVGVSSGFPYAMIGAILTTRLAQDVERERVDGALEQDIITSSILADAEARLTAEVADLQLRLDKLDDAPPPRDDDEED